MDKYYQRNLIKDKLQDYVLNFVYNDKIYKKLIFTGGTCLRKLYNLPRLSEDLDFDYPTTLDFDIRLFSQKLQNYFRSLLQVRLIGIKLAKNKKTVFLRFSASDFLPQSTVSPNEVIFIRGDFSQATSQNYTTEVTPFRSNEFSFFILSYDLPTLFANKITAFLQRQFFKGKSQTISFKGRDLFDIYWFINLSSKSGFKLKPNWNILSENFPQLSKEQIIDTLIEKVKRINTKDILIDISPFIKDKEYLSNFIQNYQATITAKASFIV